MTVNIIIKIPSYPGIRNSSLVVRFCGKSLDDILKARSPSSHPFHIKPKVLLADESAASFEKTYALIGSLIAQAVFRIDEFGFFCECETLPEKTGAKSDG